jgi:hypothetical protein
MDIYHSKGRSIIDMVVPNLLNIFIISRACISITNISNHNTGENYRAIKEKEILDLFYQSRHISLHHF